MNVIAKSAYNVISFPWGIFKFIDTRRFLSDDEEVLAAQLANRMKKYDGTDDPKSKPDFCKFKQLRS
jgi:hypothetical protein